MVKHLLLLVSFMSLAYTGYSQQDPMFTKYMFNSLVYNPAYAGSHEHMSVRLLYRQQWMGVSGAPVTQSFTIHTPMNDRVGLGLSVLNDAIGVHGSTNANLSYAYRFSFGSGKLALGVQAGAANWRSNWDQLKFKQSIDEDHVFAEINPNQWLFNVGGGIFYYSKSFYAGFSVPRIINQELQRTASNNPSPSNARIATLYRHYYFSAGGIIPLSGNDLLFKPSILVKSVGLFGGFIDASNSLTRIGSPTEFDIDLSLMFNEVLWIGLSFRSALEAFIGNKSSYDSVDAWASIYLGNGLRIGAAYDYPINKINLVSSGSFEVMLGYDFDYNMKKVETPRYF